MANILIVEDEPAIAESLSFALRRDGFNVDTANHLADGYTKLDAADLVLLDLMLPDGSGFDLIVDIRRQSKKTAIIVLSSRDDEPDRVAALEAGADDYVTKPFSPREMVARVRAVLRRMQCASDIQEPSISPGGDPHGVTLPPHLALQIDVPARRTTVSGTVLDLTRVEFDLLMGLAEQAGRVYKRIELINRVWGDGFNITDRTVDSHIKGLRKKIADAGGNPSVLETVRGVGYRIAVEIPRRGPTA
ncbi:MAG: response regulator transcription factor [Polyangiaceae bacterium]|nr:response regulator transcription factor [Polyangiaceae bacterium]